MSFSALVMVPFVRIALPISFLSDRLFFFELFHLSDGEVYLPRFFDIESNHVERIGGYGGGGFFLAAGIDGFVGLAIKVKGAAGEEAGTCCHQQHDFHGKF